MAVAVAGLLAKGTNWVTNWVAVAAAAPFPPPTPAPPPAPAPALADLPLLPSSRSRFWGRVAADSVRTSCPGRTGGWSLCGVAVAVTVVGETVAVTVVGETGG